VRARIDTIEEQIQQLITKKLELQKVAKVVSAAGGSETPPGIDPEAGDEEDTGKGVGAMEEGPPVMSMSGQPTKPGEESSAESKSDSGACPLTSGLRVASKCDENQSSRLDHLEAEVIYLKDEASSAHRAMCRMETKVEELTNSAKCANSELRSDGTGRPAQIDRKIIERPSKYKGDIKVFIQWHERLKTYLASQDKRWSKLLDSIESRGPNPLKCTSDFMEISEAADIQEYHEDFTKQLYLYLDTFTDGPANIAVTTAGVTMAYESYRRIAEKG